MGQFQKGQSGNPAGKKKGTRSSLNAAALNVLDENAEELLKKCVELAKAGNPTALRLTVERILPLSAMRRIEVPNLPALDAAGIGKALDGVTKRVADGEMSLDDAKEFATLLEAKRKAIETEDLAKRIDALEQRT